MAWEDELAKAIGSVSDPGDDALRQAIEQGAAPPEAGRSLFGRYGQAIKEEYLGGINRLGGVIKPTTPEEQARSIPGRALDVVTGGLQAAFPVLSGIGGEAATDIASVLDRLSGRYDDTTLQQSIENYRKYGRESTAQYLESLLAMPSEERAKAAAEAARLPGQLIGGVAPGYTLVPRALRGMRAGADVLRGRAAARAADTAIAARQPRAFQEPTPELQVPAGPQRPIDWVEPVPERVVGPELQPRPTILEPTGQPMTPTTRTAAEVGQARVPEPKPLLIADEFGRPIPQNYLVQQIERVIDEVPDVSEAAPKPLRRAGEVAEEATGGRIEPRPAVPEREVSEADFWRLAGEEGRAAETEIQRALRESVEPPGPGAARTAGELPEGALRPGEEPITTVPPKSSLEEPYVSPGRRALLRPISGGAEEPGWIKPTGEVVPHTPEISHGAALEHIHGRPGTAGIPGELDMYAEAFKDGWIRYNKGDTRGYKYLHLELLDSPDSLRRAEQFIREKGGRSEIRLDLANPQNPRRTVMGKSFNLPHEALAWIKSKLGEETGAFFPSREAKEKAPRSLRELRGRQAEGPAPVPVEPAKPVPTQREAAAKRVEEIKTRPVDVGAVPNRQAGRMLRRDLPETERLVTENLPVTEREVPGFNLDTINAPADVERIIANVAEGQRTLIEKARGPKVTDDYLRTVAAESGLSPADLMKRNKDNPFTKVEVVRYKSVVEASAKNVRQKLNELTEAGGPTNVAARDSLREAIGKHAMIAGAFARGRAETGRALRAFQTIPDDVLDDIIPLLRELDPQNVAVLTTVSRKAADPTWWDKFMFVITNARLTSPVTHGVNIGSNTSMLATVPVRKVFEGRPVEALYDVIGMWDMIHTNRALESATAAFSSRIPMAGMERYAERLKGLGTKFETSRQLENTRLRPFRSEGGKEFQRYAEQPGRALAAEDNFFRSIIANGELTAMGLREAKKRGITGKAREDFIQSFVASEATDEAILKAWNSAKYNTFNAKLGGLGQKLLAVRKTKVMGTEAAPLEFFFNFVTTPTNIGKVAIEHSPLGFLKAVRAHKLYKEGRLAEEMSKPMAGTAGLIATYAFMWTMDGKITGRGPSDPAKRKVWLENHKPYSVEWESGGKRHAVSYERFAPASTVLGAAADIWDGYNDVVGGLQKTDREIGDYAKLMGRAAGSVGQNILNQTYWQQLNTLAKAISEPDRFGEQLARSITGELQPVAAISALARAVDPYKRQVGPLEQPVSEIPFASRLLRKQRGAFGQEQERPGGTGTLGFINRLLSPAQYEEVGKEPLMRELERSGVGIGKADRKLPNGSRMNDEQFERFEILSGTLFKEKLRDLADSLEFQEAETEEERKTQVGSALSEARQEAREQLVEDGVLPEDALEPTPARTLLRGR
jgi:hypothetical protein